MHIVVKKEDSTVSELDFPNEEEVTLGSHAECDINLPVEGESSQNALLTPTEEGQWLIENLTPETEIYVNEHPIRDRVTLRNGDTIALDDFQIVFSVDESASEQAGPAEPEMSAEDLAKIKKFPLPPGSVVHRYQDSTTLTRPQLDAASEAAAKIATFKDINHMVDESLDMLVKAFKARAAWFGIRRQSRGELDVQGGRLASGRTEDWNSIIELLVYRCLERRQHIRIRKVRDHEYIGSAMAVPLICEDGALGMIYVDRDNKQQRFRGPDLELLTAIASHLGKKLSMLIKGQIQRSAEVSATEISVVHAIQEHLDPRTSSTFGRVRTAAYSRSGQENPGDVYDVMQHPDTQMTAFMLGHVNATGALLALSMARMHSTFRVGFLHTDPPNALARELNWLMYDERDPSTVDAVFILLNPKTGAIKYTRAGKVGAFIVAVDGQPRALQGAESPPIGKTPNFEYQPLNEQLQPGETLAIYTRGTASCTNSEGQRFGEHRFIELVCDSFGQSPAAAVQDLAHELTSFFEKGAHPDDITISLLQMRED
jgi:serine phosphatase RsbU (regulator of sigma subunit)